MRRFVSVVAASLIASSAVALSVGRRRRRGRLSRRRDQSGVRGRRQLRRDLHQRLHRALQPRHRAGAARRLDGAVRQLGGDDLGADPAQRHLAGGVVLPRPRGAGGGRDHAASNPRRHGDDRDERYQRKGRARHLGRRPVLRERLRRRRRRARFRRLRAPPTTPRPPRRPRSATRRPPFVPPVEPRTPTTTAPTSASALRPRGQCGDACEPPPPPSGCDVAPTHRDRRRSGHRHVHPGGRGNRSRRGCRHRRLQRRRPVRRLLHAGRHTRRRPRVLRGHLRRVERGGVRGRPGPRRAVPPASRSARPKSRPPSSTSAAPARSRRRATTCRGPWGSPSSRSSAMLLTFPEALSATEHFQLGRFGEVTVSSDGRLFQPTDRVAPGAPAIALADENQRRRLLLDDGSNVQNPPTVPFLTPDVLRLGDTATGITGVLGFGFGNFRLQPTQADHVRARRTRARGARRRRRRRPGRELQHAELLHDARQRNEPGRPRRQQRRRVRAPAGQGGRGHPRPRRRRRRLDGGREQRCRPPIGEPGRRPSTTRRRRAPTRSSPNPCSTRRTSSVARSAPTPSRSR